MSDHTDTATIPDEPDMSSAFLHVVYDGPALEQHRMDVRQLAPALLALGEVLEEANHIINDDRTKVSVQVRASFKAGCFGIDFDVAQSFARQVMDFFNSDQITAANNLLTLLGFAGSGTIGLISLIKWLRGRKIQNVVILESGKVKVIVEGNDAIEVEKAVIDLFRSYRLRKALDAAVKQPLDEEGIDSFATTTDPEKASFATVTKSERHYYATPPQEDELISESEDIAVLQLVNIAFREDNKWRFSDGSSTFFAELQDEDFRKRVDENDIAFSKGDILRVRLAKRQTLVNEDMKAEYRVLEVLEHRKAGTQLKLPFSQQTPPDQ